MSTLGINIGLKALLTAQANLETIGHNVSNASTPGYSRQTLQTSASSPIMMRGLLRGTGVQGDAINRAVDQLLQARISSQVASIGRIDARLDTLSNVETLLDGGGEGGVSALLKSMFQSFSSLSTAPEDSILRAGAIQSSASLAGELNSLASRSLDLERNVFARLRANVDQVNALAERIGALNRQISGVEAGSRSANDLRDTRDQAIKQLAQYVDVRTVEDQNGGMRVLVSGRTLVSPTAHERLSVAGDPAKGDVGLRLAGQPIEPGGGALGGLLGALTGPLPGMRGEVDVFARNLILETNRAHSTGVPASGSFRRLTASNPLIDRNRDGDFSDELLAQAGLPFDVSSGRLYVNVIDDASGALTKHQIAIDPLRTTVGQLVGDLNAIPGLAASVDPQGVLQLAAAPGKRFDFSARLDGAPDKLGAFGGGRATLGSAGAGPFALTAGDTLDFSGPLGAFSVAMNSASFAQIGAASASEVAAVLNADASFAASGLVASDLGGALVLQTAGAGASQSFQLAGGSAAGVFGWSAGTTVVGQDTAVAPSLSGAWGGAQNGELVFRPNMDGRIGVTSGLRIEVFDASGTKLTELDVGPGYTPGDELDVANGLKASFGVGAVSASNNEFFRVDVVADADTSDVLVALGLNSLFVGSSAADIAVRADLVADSSLFAASASGAAGDAGALIELLKLETRGLAGLGGASLDERLTEMVGGVALEIDAARGARDSESFLLEALETRRDQISGVNTDEELVRMIEQEQAYNMAAQFLRVVNDITSELLRII